MNDWRRFGHIMWQLFLTDCMLFKRVLANKLLDRGIWVLTYVIIMGHIMPAVGISTTFGAFFLAGTIATIGVLETYSSAVALIADFEGDQTISYFLTLPIPSVLIFVRIIGYYAFHFAALGLFLLPLGNLFLGSRSIPYASIAWGKLILIFMIINIFHGALVLWVASTVKSVLAIGQIWSRILHPMWFFGGFQFSWHVVHNLFPQASYLLLLNPIMYSTEAMRAALLGQAGFLPFWPCTGILVLFTAAMSWHAIARLKRRLDFV